MNRHYNKTAWLVTLIYIPFLFAASLLFQGCATAGSISPEIISQSAAVDTDISELQTQQATTAESIQSVVDTTQSIDDVAKEIKNDKLTGLVETLKSKVGTASDSHKSEITQTVKVQSDYSALKVTAGTNLVNQSSKIIKQEQQIKVRNKWIAILAVIIFIHLLLDAAVLMLKFYFHKI